MTNDHSESLVLLLTCEEVTLKSTFLCAVAIINPRFMRSGFHTRMVTVFDCHSVFLVARSKSSMHFSATIFVSEMFFRRCCLWGQKTFFACRTFMAQSRARCFSLLQLVLMAFLLLTCVSSAYSIVSCSKGCKKNKKGRFVCLRDNRVVLCTPPKRRSTL
jgi:hypothetical protein